MRGMSAEQGEPDDLTASWKRAQDRLPPGWTLDSLRCASTGLAPSDRSGDWIAIAIDPAGGEHRFRAADPVAALEGLVAGRHLIREAGGNP